MTVQKILITKSLSNKEEDLLRKAGIHFDVMPAMTFTYEFDRDKAVNNLSDPGGHWVFTSHRSILALRNLLSGIKPPKGILTVGQKSSDLLNDDGFPVSFSGEQSEDLVEKITPESVSKIYYFRGNRFRSTIPDHCHRNKIDYAELECYQAVPQQIHFEIKNYSGLWVFSPLSAKTVLHNNMVPKDFPIFAIGPVTAKYLNSEGYKQVKYCENPSFVNLMAEFNNHP